MQTLLTELRHAARQLVKSPGFSATVVLILALGIGATTAIFSLVEGILLRPLPFRDPGRLVTLGEHVGDNPGIGVTARDIGAYAEQTTAFASVAGYRGVSYEFSGSDTPETMDAVRANSNLFSTLGVQPVLGRVFSPKEEENRQSLAIIGYALWLDRYHRDPNILGKTIALDRKPYTIIGVMPRGFEFPVPTGQLHHTELWVPLSLSPEEVAIQNAGVWGYRIVARLKDGVTPEQAAQDANRVAQQIMRSFPPSMSRIHIRGDVQLLREETVGEIRPLLRILFAAVSIVLLLACVNVAGLLLLRSIRRRRIYAIRLALGAQPAVLIREAVFEGVLLSLAGGLLGLTLGAAAIRLVLHYLPESMPRIDSVSIDASVAAFALLLGIASGVLCSLAPAFAALRTNLIASLKDGVPTGTGAASHAWLRSSLVVLEIAIALILLNLSGVFLRSFQKMRAVDPGFRPDKVLVAGYNLPIHQYPTDQSAQTFTRAVLDRLKSQPGTVAAGATNTLPATGFYGMSAYTIDGRPVEGWKLKFAAFTAISGDYLSAMSIPVLQGRAFTENDRAGQPLVVLVNQTMARDCWPGENPIGKRMHAGNPHKGLPWATVVGVVADIKGGAPDQPAGEQWYVPAEQPSILNGSNYSGVLTLPTGGYITLRSALPPEAMIQTLRSTVATVDPLLALDPIQPMNAVVSNIEAPRRFNSGLITGFALGALLLAVTGMYAVVAFSVSLRTQEIAIRMALGAQRRAVARLVLWGGVKMALIGCALGLVGSLALARLVASFLFQVSPTDPAVYVGGVGVMMLLAVIASAIPATRAASADPVQALRSN